MAGADSGAGPGAQPGGGGMCACRSQTAHGDNPAELDDITEFLKRLDPTLAAPVTETSIWLTSDAGADFEPNAAAPIMRTQEHRPSGECHY